MKQKVLPTTVTLKEDDDQGESDIAFFATSVAYSIFVFVSPFIFTGEDYVGLGKFCLVMTNMFASFQYYKHRGCG